MSECVFQAEDEAATASLGKVLAETLPEGTTVALIGDLGAGKTRLVQAIAAALDIPAGEVVSPSFLLIQEYHGRRALFHIDAFRLRSEEEFLALGPEEYFASPGITVVEWADRVAGSLPPEHLEIRIAIISPRARRFQIRAIGRRFDTVVEQLGRALGCERL